MFRYENPLHSLVDISTNLLSSSVDQFIKPIEVVADLDKVDLKSVNDVSDYFCKNLSIISLFKRDIGMFVLMLYIYMVT